MQQSIIASSLSEVPGPALRGYAQVGGDFILGESGRREYGEVPAGRDGAYVSVTTQGDGEVAVGSDAAGYGRLFLYQRGHRWALGSSLMELADYVRSVDWPLGVDQLQLKQFLFKSNMLVNQLLSLDTVFSEIRLIGASEEVVISPGPVPTLRIRRREVDAPSDYQAALQDALDEMVGRLRSLIESGLPISSAITGGRDSRAVLAALRIAHGSSEGLGEVVRFRSNERSTRDLEVAKGLSNVFGLRLNRPVQTTTYPVDPLWEYRLWRANDLGVYSAIYRFLNYTAEVSLGGVGAETHRLTYTDPTLSHRLKRLQTSYVTEGDTRALSMRIDQSLDHLGGHEDPRIEHYRQFRNRFHGGRVPLRTLDIAPLNSEKLKVASNMMSPQHLDRAQLLADMMLNLAPDLAAYPYDDAGKAWNLRHYDEFTPLKVDPDRYSGAVYGEVQSPPGVEQAPHRPLEPFIEAFHASAPAAIESGLLPRGFVQESANVLRETKGRRFRHATEARGVSTVILAGQISELSSSG